MRRSRAGIVSLVGAGPGDPDLITLRGRDLLSRADVVVHDRLVPAALLMHAPKGAEIVEARTRGRRGAFAQARLNRLMIARARRGLRVVRLKGGDPSLFGRAAEEMEALRAARVRFEVVPGITAALGAAATAGIPLTHRRLASSVVLATAHEDPSKAASAIDWPALARADTIVLYMAVARLRQVARRLVAAGRRAGTPAAVVRWATRADQSVLETDLAGLARGRARPSPPALLIVGDVVRLRRRLDWRSRRPLAGRTIVVTRAREQSALLARPLEEAGARVLAAPAIRLAEPASWKPLDRAIARLEDYSYVIFTSVNGVDRFFGRLAARRRDVRDLRGARIVAIGPATAEAVARRGLRVELVPAEYRAEGIVAALRGRALSGARVLLPRAAVARDLLPAVLRRRGARVDVVPVYRTLPSREGLDEVRRALRTGAIDLVTFTSSSTVKEFVGRLGPADRRRLRRVPAGVIGPITAATARESGLTIAVMPREATVGGLVEEIVSRLKMPDDRGGAGPQARATRPQSSRQARTSSSR